MSRLFCLLLGYVFGCLLTGELISRYKTGHSARAIGSGNPGTANIGAHLGFKWGLLVLMGDIIKAILACWLGWYFCGKVLGRLALFYAGLGAVLGHNYPCWLRFRGGKGVAVTCALLILYAPLWGIAACLLGLAVVLLSGYLALGAVVIPAVFILPAFLCYGPETGLLAILTALLMLRRHYPSLVRIRQGTERKSLQRFRPKKP